MSITRSDKGANKEISEMGVGLGPEEGLNGGRMRDRIGGSDWKGRTGGVRQGTGWRVGWRVGREVGLGRSDGVG